MPLGSKQNVQRHIQVPKPHHCHSLWLRCRLRVVSGKVEQRAVLQWQDQSLLPWPSRHDTTRPVIVRWLDGIVAYHLGGQVHTTRSA